MKVFGSFLCLTIVSVFVLQPLVAQSKRLHFGKCALSVDLPEIREYFSAIRQTVVTEDVSGHLRLLSKSTFHGIQAEDSCCFLRHLLRFYVENVFKHYTPTSDLIKRKTSSLANSFLSVKRDLRQCLNQNAAVVKAIGEIDILIHWMENFD
ncbi:interleukin-20-like [Callorhinchus milii]|uniref:interleukin-20-like n=1 Tax=Callorhinchus milii TaxID=7868 RepID=UPI001C3FEA89|nr:interleukin-20-like [Callorhinchus milii]